MSFPISITGTISLPKNEVALASVEQTVIRIGDLLDTAVATSVVRDGASISFTAGFFRIVGSWNILTSINSGTIIVCDKGSELRIDYRLSTLQLLIGATVLVGMFWILALAHPPPSNQTNLWGFLVFGWLWLFGGNYVLAARRFPRWLERGLRRTVPSDL